MTTHRENDTYNPDSQYSYKSIFSLKIKNIYIYELGTVTISLNLPGNFV